MLAVFFAGLLSMPAPPINAEDKVSAEKSQLEASAVPTDSLTAVQSPTVPLPSPEIETAIPHSAQAMPLAVTGLRQPIIPTQRVVETIEPLASVLVTPDAARAEDPDPALAQQQSLPSLEEFVSQVADGQAGVLRGVYVAGVMALKIIQQPPGDVSFVSEDLGIATEFQSAAVYGVIGLLAHNFLSGELFHHLVPDQEITVVYGDSSLQKYRVTEIADFERLDPADLKSDFRHLASDQLRSVEEVFYDFYGGDPHLTLQTCIEKDSDWSWGVRFIVAEPIG
jgi:hypothetical protein